MLLFFFNYLRFTYIFFLKTCV